MNSIGTIDYERLRERLNGPPDPVCPVCRKPIQKHSPNLRSQITCSPHCSYVYAKCRNYFDPEAHDKHARRNARYIVNHPDKHQPSTVEWAKKVLAGEPVKKRVVRKDSEVYALLESVGRLDLLPDA